MKYLLILLLVPIIILPAFAQTNSQTLPTEKGTLDVKLSYDDINPGDQSRLLIQFINPQTQKIQEHIDYRLTVSKDGESIFGPIPLTHTSSGEVKGLKVEFVEEGNHKVDFEVEGILFQPIPLETVSFDIPVGDASAQSDVTSQEEFSDVVVVSVPEGTSLQGCEGTNECYIPYEARVNVGGKVVWLNEDMAFHTVTSGNPGEGPDDLFDSGMFTKDEQFSHTFENSGNYDYFCTLHPWMEGVVIVLETMAEDPSKDEGGGCLIATATYGSELAPQVQILRELRDNKLLQTESGTAFMQGFNDFYYSFSPHIADYERENPYFKEAVKITLTPMISSLSILNYVDMDSEAEVLGYGISLILLNVGMYVGAPAMVIFGIKKRF